MFVAKFTGGVAEQHKLPAYEAGKSMEGIARSLTMTNHYLFTGELRHRYPFDQSLQVFLRPSRAGSFESVFEFYVNNEQAINATLGTVSLGLVANFATDFFKLVYSKAIGKKGKPDTELVKKLAKDREGDVAAVVEAVTPAALRAHTVIGNGCSGISIINGDNNVIIMDSQSKRFLEETHKDYTDIVAAGVVSAFNANNKTGRAYIYEEARTIPFKLEPNVDEKTLGAIAVSLSSYISRIPADVNILFWRQLAYDGTIKQLVVRRVRKLED